MTHPRPAKVTPHAADVTTAPPAPTAGPAPFSPPFSGQGPGGSGCASRADGGLCRGRGHYRSIHGIERCWYCRGLPPSQVHLHTPDPAPCPPPPTRAQLVILGAIRQGFRCIDDIALDLGASREQVAGLVGRLRRKHMVHGPTDDLRVSA